LQPAAAWGLVTEINKSVAMRRILLAFALLAACEMTAPGESPAAGPSAISDDTISVTTLDATPSGASPPAVPEPAVSVEPAPTEEDTPRPKPRPAATEEAAAVTPEQTEPQVAKTAEQVLCERSGGQWAVAGKTGAFICVRPTRDGGKMCTKKGDCQGLCLARSGTCAPFSPLFGCNEVLEKDGRRVTLCID
jgi:hypothetical protein